MYIPLCLWCKWTSPEAAVAFEAAISRRRGRSISGPNKVIWKTDLSDLARERKKSPVLRASFPRLGALRGLKPPVGDTLLDSAHAVLAHPHSDRGSIIRATARATSSLGTDLPLKPPTLRIRRGLPATNVVVPSQHPTTRTTPTIPSPSPNTTPMSVQLKNTIAHPVSLPPIVSPSLRRKHHMTMPRPKSTRSLRSWTPAVSPPQHVPATSVARLGHPSRPYYTAIRPHFNDWGTRSSTPAPGPPTLSDTGQMPPPPAPERPSFEFTRPRSSMTSGWSLSGEMELQIKLSQRREGEEEEGAVGKRGSIARGVRRLGIGLRDLVLRRG